MIKSICYFMFLILLLPILLIAESGKSGRELTKINIHANEPEGIGNPPPVIAPAGNPQVAMDDDGNVLIVWYQLDGSHNQVFKAECRQVHLCVNSAFIT